MSRRYKNPNKGKNGELIVKTKAFQSKRYHKARIQVARKHLDVSGALTRTLRDWRRKDFVVKTARALIQSNDLVAYEDLKVRNFRWIAHYIFRGTAMLCPYFLCVFK